MGSNQSSGTATDKTDMIMTEAIRVPIEGKKLMILNSALP